MGALGALQALLARQCLGLTRALRQRDVLEEGDDHPGSKSKRSPATGAHKSAGDALFRGRRSPSGGALPTGGGADGGKPPPAGARAALPAALRARPSRREQLLLLLMLACLAQISWMRRAQSESLIMWVRDSIEDPDPGQPQPRHALLPATEVLPHSPDACADALRVPRVALMFLTTGDLYHEETWRLWFKSAAGVLPAQVVASTVCSGDGVSAAAAPAAAACAAANASRGGAIASQHLFSVYIHAPPAFEGYEPESLWAGRLVRHRVTTSWGAHTLVEATRHLLWEAFRDPLNSRFLLLSESDIPLYDPLTLYQQLQAEAVSRLDTCRHHSTSQWRWDPRMETPKLKFHMWRKSPQWLSLTRPHVALALRDEEVYRKFERHCWSAWDAANARWHRDCFSDEHYFATLLAAEGRDAEGVCESRGISYTEWAQGSAHPKAFTAAVVDADLIRRARAAPRSSAGAPTAPCDWAAAQSAAETLFVPTALALGPQAREVCGRYWRDQPAFHARLPETCFLTARKFPWEARDRVRAVFLQCTSGVNLLRRDVCAEEGGTSCNTLWARIKGRFARDPC